ncbi:MAG: SpoIIIAH-like family protein [Clostridia bacterium]|jgi:stage III sporulation protein AH|nr:SpoIIIAH-like family protein [Clostridia bacterium]
MKKRTKIIILSFMIVLLGATGYLNIVLNNSVKQTNTEVATASYFTSYRNDRESTRDQEILYYDAIIDSPSSSEAAIVAAEQAKMELVSLMEKELAVEGLIKAQGFEDCVIAISNEKVNVVVKGSSLTENEVAQISTIVKEQLDTQLKNIVIIPAE